MVQSSIKLSIPQCVYSLDFFNFPLALLLCLTFLCFLMHCWKIKPRLAAAHPWKRPSPYQTSWHMGCVGFKFSWKKIKIPIYIWKGVSAVFKRTCTFFCLCEDLLLTWWYCTVWCSRYIMLCYALNLWRSKITLSNQNETG